MSGTDRLAVADIFVHEFQTDSGEWKWAATVDVFATGWLRTAVRKTRPDGWATKAEALAEVRALPPRNLWDVRELNLPNGTGWKGWCEVDETELSNFSEKNFGQRVDNDAEPCYS